MPKIAAALTLSSTFMVAVSLAVTAIPEILLLLFYRSYYGRYQNDVTLLFVDTAVETLGCTQVICSDKTTLTQNKTVVVAGQKTLTLYVRTMALCCDATWDDAKQVAKGGFPTEAALVADAAKLGYTTSDLASSRPRIGEAPADSSRKMMSVVVHPLTSRCTAHQGCA